MVGMTGLEPAKILLIPNQARYQTSPHPDRYSPYSILENKGNYIENQILFNLQAPPQANI